ncbi:MAG TPA: carboxypeptidase-like regulatory domain-containing protein, partial [Pyrinomonadaceae bacterium]|nr:carboxypeptidase-like regulatory domain-containing protein [Pyrinomonadaceae bacterium]
MKFFVSLWLLLAPISGVPLQGNVTTQSTTTFDQRILQVEEGSLAGTLLDPDSKPVSGALITVSRRSTNPLAKYTSYTDGRGRFYFSQIAVGKYDIGVESSDPWLKDTSTVVTVRHSQRTDVRIVLELNKDCDKSA